MNIKTTLVLLVVAGGLLAAWAGFFAGGPGEVTPWTGRPFFGDFVPTDAARIRIHDASGDRMTAPVELARSQGRWQVSSPAVEDGHAVNARERVAADVLDAVQAVTPLRIVNENPSSQDEIDLGLDARHRLEISVDGPTMDAISLQFGAKVGAGEVTCRASSRREVFAVPREVLRRLAPRAEDAVDPALLRLDVLDVRRLRVAVAGAEVLDVERGHQRWFMNKPFQAAPGDSERCDQLRSAVLSLAIAKRLWDKKPEEVVPAPAPWQLTVRTATGIEHVIHLGKRVKDGLIAARLEGAEHAVIVSDDILAVLDGDWGRFRDRHPIEAPASRLISVALEQKNGEHVAFRRVNQTVFRIELPDRRMREVPTFADDVEMSSFLAQLRGIELLRFVSDDATFEPDVKVTVTVHDPGAQKSIDRAYEIGPASGGMRPLRVVGQPGLGHINADAATFLTKPYWTLIERRAKCTDAYFKLGKLEFRDDKGTIASYVGRIPGAQQDLILARDRGGNLTDIPDELKTRLVHHMIEGISVDSWLGEKRTDEMGFDKPRLLMRWFEPKGASVNGIPSGDEGEWRALVIGARRADGLHYATFDEGLVDLVFLVDPKDIAPFTDMLK